jgi:hypothetical protein
MINEKIASAGEKNKIVPVWLRAFFVLPCLAACVWLMIYMGNVYMYIAEIEASILDGSYYVILTFLLTAVVYGVVLIVCLVPALILTNIARKFYERKQRQNHNAMGDGNSQTVVSDRNKYT